jgi:hypothetical protein
MAQPEHRRLSYPAAARLLLALLTFSLAGCSRAAESSSPTSAPAVVPTNVVAHVSEGPPIPLSTAGHIGGLVRGVPVVAGGSSWVENRTKKRWNHECFAFRDGKWVIAPSLPQPLSDAAYACGPGGLYAAGGTDGKNPTTAVLHLADASTGASWQRLAPLPETIEAASGAFATNNFYVFGGFSGGKPSNRLWALDVTKRNATWRSVASLPADGRGYTALVAADDQLYLFGGFVSPPYTSKVTVFADAYRYDPAADRWTKLEGFALPGYAWTATAVGPRQVMLTGRAPQVSVVSDEILLVNPSTLDVRPIGHLMIPGCCMPAIPVARRTWWLPGGEPDTNRSRTERTSIVTLEESQTHE